MSVSATIDGATGLIGNLRVDNDTTSAFGGGPVDFKAFPQRSPEMLEGIRNGTVDSFAEPDTFILIDKSDPDSRYAPEDIGLSPDDIKGARDKSLVDMKEATPDQLTLEAAGGDATTAKVDAALNGGASLEEANAEATPVGVEEEAVEELEPIVLTTPDFQVKLISKANVNEQVLFKVSPTIDEGRAAVYDNVQPVHHPGSIQIYKTTTSRNFNINGKFIARNSEEADENIVMMNLIRAWVMPYYGIQTSQDEETSNRLGAPPPILELSAYGPRNWEVIPVVLTNYSWQYSDDVTYIPDSQGNPVPVILDVTLVLQEAYSPSQMSNFSLSAYKRGDLRNSF